MLTKLQKIENFAFMINRPFTVAEAADLCDCKVDTAEKALKKMRQNGRIDYRRRNGRLVYVWIEKAKKRSKNKDWVPDRKKILAVCDYLQQYGYTSLREVAVECRISHETVRKIIHKYNIEMVNERLLKIRQEKATIKDLIRALKAIRFQKYTEQRTRIIAK